MASSKWTLADELNRPVNLRHGDYCYYYLIYTPHAGFQYSPSNQDVYNYKIPIGTDKGLRAHPNRKRYKLNAIRKYAAAITDFALSERLGGTGQSLASHGKRIGLIPMPPSMCPNDKDYDDRNVQTCRLVCDHVGFKFCCDIETVQTIVPSHSGGTRQVPAIESSLTRVAHDADSCERVYLVDDVLVTGAHFVAAKSLLAKTGFSGEVRGLFFARAAY